MSEDAALRRDGVWGCTAAMALGYEGRAASGSVRLPEHVVPGCEIGAGSL
jgi:hypothetical protein